MELLCAFLLDAAIGDPAWLPHPVIQMGHLINLLEKHLRRQNAAKTNQLVSGAVLVLLVLAASYGSSKLLLFTADWLHKYLGLLVSVVYWHLPWPGAAGGGRIVTPLRAGDLPAARYAVGLW